VPDVGIRWFRSKVDWWLGLLLVAVPLVELTVLFSALRSGEREAVTPGAVGVLVVAAIYGLLLIPVRYGLSDECLVVRFGVVRRRIRLDSIDEVRRTHNPLAAPALSLDRLSIRTDRGPGSSLISPLEREEFLSDLAMRAELARDGDRLVRQRAKSV